MLDFSSIAVLAGRIGTLVDQIRNHENEHAVPVGKLERIMRQFGQLVATSVAESGLEPKTEAKLLDNIERRWRSIRL